MNVVAFIAVRNGSAYMANALRRLVADDIEFVILDNASEDETLEIVMREEFRTHLRGIRRIPYTGEFNLAEQLTQKSAAIAETITDWVVHMDVDEILEPRHDRSSLKDAIVYIDKMGFDAIDFDEFVFLPLERSYISDINEVQPIRSYYFFRPYAPRLMRAWKKASGLTMITGAGHILSGGDLRLFPITLTLRHYIVTSQTHALSKYTNRSFALSDLARGWHGNRLDQPMENFHFPAADQLCWLPTAESRAFDRDQPRADHYWQW